MRLSPGMKNVLSQYRIRKLWPLENGVFRRHLLRLDEETRHFRFGTAVNNTCLNSYADTARRIGTVIYGAFVGSEMYASASTGCMNSTATAAAME